MSKVTRTPPERNLSGSDTTMATELDIAELQRRLQHQERIIRQLQEQQQRSEQPQGTPITSSDFNFGNFIHFSIRDALEAVPSFDGDNIAFTHFVEGCEEALSMIAPSQEIILVRAIRNKLKGDAHRSILGKVFSSLQDLVEFLRNKYGPRETVYEAQARLAYMCQKGDEKVSSYANRVREIGKRIIDAQKRQSNEISQDFRKSIEEHLKICFLRGLNPEIIISKEGTFEELESRAIDAERELETVKTIRQIVLGGKTSSDSKNAGHTPVHRVGAEPTTCQYCHKIGHTADRCRLINRNQPARNFLPNTSPGQTNFTSNNRNYNNTRIPPPPGGSQNPGNTSQIICRYCRKVGHTIENCRKRAFNNQVRNSQMQGNEKIPVKTGVIPGNTNIRPTRAITTTFDTDIEQ